MGMDKQEIKKRVLDAIEAGPHRNAIKSVALFGSYVNGDAREDSDVDVLIDFQPTAKIGFFELFDIQRNLESFVGRPIDLLTPQAVSIYFRDQVLAQAESIYEGR